tara:strand:- start:397 stop:738 length:342 start_codon:yes stop_codon:yes gene_type:complete
MTIQYKNQGFALANATSTIVLTVPTTAVAIVKSISIANTSTGNVLAQCWLNDSSASTSYEFYRQDITAATTVQASYPVLNLEAGDSISVAEEAGNALNGVISYALIDRSQENG